MRRVALGGGDPLGLFIAGIVGLKLASRGPEMTNAPLRGVRADEAMWLAGTRGIHGDTGEGAGPTTESILRPRGRHVSEARSPSVFRQWDEPISLQSHLQGRVAHSLAACSPGSAGTPKRSPKALATLQN